MRSRRRVRAAADGHGRRAIAAAVAIVLAAAIILTAACGDDAPPAATPNPGETTTQPDGVPFIVATSTATAQPSPTADAASPRPSRSQPIPLNDAELREALTRVLYEQPEESTDAAMDGFLAPGLDAIRLSRDPGNAPFLVDMLGVPPYGALYRRHIGDTLRDLTGEEQLGTDWFEWIQWVSEHPEHGVPPTYLWWKGELLSTVDPRFREFLPAEGAPHTIRPEEIVWGGVRVNGIPSLDDPEVIEAHAARYLEHDEQVFGVFLNGEARAYPLRIMNWHEMTNDAVGDVPFSLAYCTLCGSGILFDTRRTDGLAPYRFHTSGLLYRSNKLMYDADTRSLWNQFTGRPVVGELVDAGIALPILPLTLTTWGEWAAQHPDTTVLSLNTGHERPYNKPGTPGAAYYDYFASPSLMFPGGPRTGEDALRPKSQVFVVVTDTGESTAYPLDVLRDAPVLNDTIGWTSVVVVTDASGGAQAYARADHTFLSGGADEIIDERGRAWAATADGLSGPDGELAARLPGHVAFWFAYASFRPDGRLYVDSP